LKLTVIAVVIGMIVAPPAGMTPTIYVVIAGTVGEGVLPLQAATARMAAASATRVSGGQPI
jgi:hypothetical protein